VQIREKGGREGVKMRENNGVQNYCFPELNIIPFNSLEVEWRELEVNQQLKSTYMTSREVSSETGKKLAIFL
jgi:hypothetical protein